MGIPCQKYRHQVRGFGFPDAGQVGDQEGAFLIQRQDSEGIIGQRDSLIGQGLSGIAGNAGSSFPDSRSGPFLTGEELCQMQCGGILPDHTAVCPIESCWKIGIGIEYFDLFDGRGSLLHDAVLRSEKINRNLV